GRRARRGKDERCKADVGNRAHQMYITRKTKKFHAQGGYISCRTGVGATSVARKTVSFSGPQLQATGLG
ncbi:MAG: hypothetical protein ABIJ56_10530, partial [Pseudomonadota bacterium]